MKTRLNRLIPELELELTLLDILMFFLFLRAEEKVNKIEEITRMLDYRTKEVYDRIYLVSRLYVDRPDGA